MSLNNPGLVLTRVDVSKRLNINLETADCFFDSLQRIESPHLQVVEVLGERLLILEENYVSSLLDLLDNLGYDA